MTQPIAAIAVENIVKRYGDFEAVKGVTFQVAEGEIFGLLGPNGAGKSTLIRMMTTLIPVTSGKAIIAGHDVSREADAVRRAIGVIPQALTSDIDLTVEENLSIYAKLYEVPKAQRERNINDRRLDMLVPAARLVACHPVNYWIQHGERWVNRLDWRGVTSYGWRSDQ